MDLQEFPEIKKWVREKSEGSVNNYLTAMKLYMNFTGLNPDQMLDEAEEDMKKSRRDRGLPESRLLDFHEYLLTKHSKMKGRKTGSTGVSKNLAKMYFSAIRGFYKANGFFLNVKTPRATNKKENFKLELRPKDVKKLVDLATYLRDKSIILCMFQSGMDVSTICSLNYGDIARQLKEEKAPLMIHVNRDKESVEFHTFLGRDAIEALKLYIQERERKYGEKLQHDTPLFVKEGAKKLSFERITTNLIQNMFRDLVLTAGIVTEDELEVSDINPARPHALRSAFSTILKLEGVNELFVEYMLGHAIPYNGAYFRPHPEELRKVYSEHERALSISEVSMPMVEVEKRLKLEIEKQHAVIRELEKKVLEIGKVDRLVDMVIDRLLKDEKAKEHLASILIDKI
jgi:integrase/recombinase XerD